MATRPNYDAAPQQNILATVEHEATSVLELTDATGDALIQSMNEQRQRTSWWPFAAAAMVLVLIFLKGLSVQWPGFVMPVLMVLGIAIVAWVCWRDSMGQHGTAWDSMGQLTVLFYEPDTTATAHFESITSGVKSAASSRRLQAVASTSAYADTKYSAGASSGLKFTPATWTFGQAPGMAANVSVPILQAVKITLAFYPDRILAFQGKTVGAIDYAELEAVNLPVTFVEDGTVPSDALVTGHTWQYVNKKGGPDKRFKNNRQMPLCRYNKMQLTTRKGLDIYLMCSRDGGFDDLVRVLVARKAGVQRVA